VTRADVPSPAVTSVASRAATGHFRRIEARPLVEGMLRNSAPPGWNPIPEGTAVDRQGRLLFVSAFPDEDGANVFRFDPDTGAVEVVLRAPGCGFASLVVHRDGRFYLCDFFNGIDGGGRIAVADPDSGEVATLIDNFEGSRVVPDDLVFDRSGGFFYNDFQGDALHTVGRVIRVEADGTQRLALDGLAQPNGIALTAAEDRLWLSDHLTNRLLSVNVDEQMNLSKPAVQAYFSGGQVDSTTVDSAGNIYQAVYDGGRVEVLDSDANPVAIVVPGPDPLRRYPRTTHVAIEPGGRRAYLVAGGPGGVGVFGFEAIAEGLVPFSHR